MSGDVQPRKRKDKKRKKDEVSLEEHRGTAATFAEGEMLMHSQHDHGTGGHWCAKIIFFSLLAVLVTLIGLIILENRGLTELEANAVESQYSGLLDGWIEDAPDDDHHDEHTLELKHHHNEDIDEHVSENVAEFDDDDDDGTEDNDDEHDEEFDHDEVDDHEDETDVGIGAEDNEDEDENLSKQVDDDDDNENEDDEPDEGDENDYDSNEDGDGEIEEQNVKTAENRYANRDDDDDDDDNDDDDEDDDDNDNDGDAVYDTNQGDEIGDVEGEDDDTEDKELDDANDNISNEIENVDDNGDDAQSIENDEDDDDNSKEEQDDEDEDEHEEDHEEEVEEEIENIEKEVSDQEESESAELPMPDVSVEKEEETSVEVVSPDEEYEVDDKAFLEVDEIDEPAVERIAPPPAGKPYVEIEEEVSTETPSLATLAEEEEYEKQQEELRQQEAQSTHMWLKLAVGGALLAATHAVIRRATAPRDAPESEQDEHASREETPLSDRRMTLIPDESTNVIPPQTLGQKIEEVVQKVSPVVKAAPVQKQESKEVEDDDALEEEIEEDQEVKENKNDEKDKELYSEDEEIEADEDVEDEEEIEEKKEVPKSILKVQNAKKEPEPKPEPEEIPDDVEIIDDEQIEEEIEEEVEDEEEISDVDDAELLSRLEAKYGRLPEPERPAQKHKDGGNSLEDEWPGEPSDHYWKEQLDKAEEELRQGSFAACERAGAARLADSGRARWLRARALDHMAEARRDNRVLTRAIAAYMRLLEMSEQISDKKLIEVALRAIDRIQFRGAYLNAEPVYRLLIRRFPDDVTYRNNLTILFLMANRADLATEVLKETLRVWPNDRVALAHYGFVLKTEQNKLEEAVWYFQRALEGDTGPANEPRFYYHLGDALLMLGRKDEAHEVHKRGTALGHFLSPSQRSLYNVPRLKSQPWWDVEKTPYVKLARELEASWREILKEGQAAQSLYEKEREGLRERGEWSQLDLFVRGREVPGRCARAPVTCRIVKKEPAAQCRRGQVKFSLLSGGSHVRAHVGPTNCRLRMHLALSNTDHTYLRVDQETRQWQVGKVLMFDDSFEHEVWHNGTRARLVLIVDVWHPALTARERLALPAI